MRTTDTGIDFDQITVRLTVFIIQFFFHLNHSIKSAKLSRRHLEMV